MIFPYLVSFCKTVRIDVTSFVSDSNNLCLLSIFLVSVTVSTALAASHKFWYVVFLLSFSL